MTAYPRGRSPYGCYDMAGNVNNWCLDGYWPDWYRHRVATGRPIRNPVLDAAEAARLDLELSEKVDRGGGFATAMQCCEVLGCTDKVHWPPTARAPWNGFRTVWAP